MSSAAITSDRSFVVERDVRCRECNYNLRGLASTSACPECGHAVSLSITDSMDSFLRCLPPDARRNLQKEVTFEPEGLWVSGAPLLVGLCIIGGGVLVGAMYGSWGILIGAGGSVVLARIVALRLIAWRERRAIARYLTRHCVDRRLNRCPLCYRDLSGAMVSTCPECGCPTSVRRLV